jgi:putative copper resistance protein D
LKRIYISNKIDIAFMEYIKILKAITVLTLLLLSLFAGCLTGANVDVDPYVVPEEYIVMENPIKPTQASISRGQEIYSENCANCHGPEGRGDGHQAMMFEPRPSNLRDAHVLEKTDGSLFYFISKGVRGTSMPPFNSFSEESRWHAVNFMRTFEVEDVDHDEESPAH